MNLKKFGEPTPATHKRQQQKHVVTFFGQLFLTKPRLTTTIQTIGHATSAPTPQRWHSPPAQE